MVIGGIDDQIAILVWERLSSSAQQWFAQNPLYFHIFNALIHPLGTNEPLTYAALKIFITLFHEHAYNLFLIVTLFANLFVGYLFFRRYKYATFLTLVFAFSAFLWLHLGKHISLAELWIVPLFFIFLQRLNQTFRSYFSLGLVLGITVLISNYLGFCLMVYVGIYFLGGLVIRRVDVKVFITVLSAAAMVVVALYPYISANYLNIVPEKADSNILVLQRTIDDFLLFSARPWYFVIPPVKTVIYGNMPSTLYARIAATGYFLADDYFEGEHGSLFLGYSLIAFLGFLFIRAYKFGDKSLKSTLTFNLICIGLLICFMMPPFFTISGITIYTPGWLIYKFFPMFRVTTRFIVLIQFILLMLAGEILTKLPFDKKKYVLIYLLLPIILLETYIPLKMTPNEPVPQELAQLSTYISRDETFATYPYTSAKQVFYYLPDYERVLVNPRGLVYGYFSSEKFTSELSTMSGLENAQKLGVKFILVYKSIPNEELAFFESTKILRKEADFTSAYLFKFAN